MKNTLISDYSLCSNMSYPMDSGSTPNSCASADVATTIQDCTSSNHRTSHHSSKAMNAGSCSDVHTILNDCRRVNERTLVNATLWLRTCLPCTSSIVKCLRSGRLGNLGSLLLALCIVQHIRS